MGEILRSVGLDVGTTTTQMVVSKLSIENHATAFSVPNLEIASREILYRSPVYFTPLLGEELVDAEGIRRIVEREYAAARIRREDIDTGAIIVTGETSRKENARAVAEALSHYAGDFVVATAGPHLESVLSAKGAGADSFSAETRSMVLHMDIGGGTSNLSLIENGEIISTGCLNVGGRLLKFDKAGRITYRSPVVQSLFAYELGSIPSADALADLCAVLVQGLEMAAGLRPAGDLLAKLWTKEAGAPWIPPTRPVVLSFSGGVAQCIAQEYAHNSFGDIGTILGKSIRQSTLCQGEFHICEDAIGATVIGAGSHSMQLSGSTVFHRDIQFPLKNLPVVSLSESDQESPFLAEIMGEKRQQLDQQSIIFLPGWRSPHYRQIAALANTLAASRAGMVAIGSDCAKALGHALSLRVPKDTPILCIDGVNLKSDSYLDVGAPVEDALPVIVKTLIYGDVNQ